jgi:hypothetical protein
VKHTFRSLGMISAGAVSVCAQLFMPVAANANVVTLVKYAPTTITVSGEHAMYPKHVIANDPWSGQQTSWVPVYYLQEGLKSAGVQTTWNGNTFTISSVPNGWVENVSGAPEPGSPPPGQMQFSVAGNQDSFLRAPRLVANDPTSGIETTYVPVYYVGLFLKERLLMDTVWDGAIWNLFLQQQSASLGQPIVFFQNATNPMAKLVLQPDTYVEERMPDVTPPAQTVIVYMPVYPGAVSTNPVSQISDMGTPLDGDLVDGTLYFKSGDSEEHIQSWYSKEFQKFGYTLGGQSKLGNHGAVTSDSFGYNKTGILGNPTQSPDINLGFLAQKQGDETIFKLKASYIVTPVRPQDTFIPTDIVKVDLTNGKTSRTITDNTWIANVVQVINGLQVSTPGISSGGPNISGTPEIIHAEFYGASGSITNISFSPSTWTVEVGNSNIMLNSGTSPELEKDLESIFE